MGKTDYSHAASRISAMELEIAELREWLAKVLGGELDSSKYRFLEAKAFAREEFERKAKRALSNGIPITGDRRGKKRVQED
jgi:hypothetical protein